MSNPCPFIKKCKKGKYLVKLSKSPACLTDYHTSCQDFQKTLEERETAFSKTLLGRAIKAMHSLFG